jgi:antitoxin component YwqK of YwqJK toxin-antitoxin module
MMVQKAINVFVIVAINLILLSCAGLRGRNTSRQTINKGHCSDTTIVYRDVNLRYHLKDSIAEGQWIVYKTKSSRWGKKTSPNRPAKNSELAMTGAIKHGVKNGHFRHYWGKKRIVRIENYKAGVLDGVYKYYVKPGILQVEGMYKEGLKDSFWFFYQTRHDFINSSIEEILYKKILYRSGYIVKCEVFGEEGEVVETGTKETKFPIDCTPVKEETGSYCLSIVQGPLYKTIKVCDKEGTVVIIGNIECENEEMYDHVKVTLLPHSFEIDPHKIKRGVWILLDGDGLIKNKIDW